MLRKSLILLPLILIFGFVPASAQTASSPLLALLERIPNTPSSHTGISFADYRALLTARPGTPNITSVQDYDAVISAGGSDAALLISALQGISSGPAFFTPILEHADTVPAVVGFDLFAIDRGIEYGEKPAMVTMLEGSFDVPAIVKAHQAQGYSADDSKGNGFTLLCGINGCYPGRHADPKAVDPTNPFGTVGLVQPVIASTNLIASSSALQNLAGIQAAIHGDLSNLGGAADIRAAAEAISLNRTLLQAEFINPDKIRPLSTAAGNKPNANQTSAIAQMSANFVPMPTYDLIALADTTTESEQQALVALVYSNQADAEAAAALFPDHLQGYISLKFNKTQADLLTSAGVTSIDSSVYSSSTGRFVLVLTLHAPLPGTDISADGKAPASNAPYTLLTLAYHNRDLEWLATQL